MNLQIDQKIISSFLLFLDNQMLKQGQAYTNYSGLFYPVSTRQSGFTTYAAPFKQLVSDANITGANVISGLYLNGNFVTVGVSGLSKINYTQGTAYFNSPLPSNTIVSGNASIKEFNISYTSEPDYKLLFETEYVQNSFYNQTLSGLSSDVKTTPAIFVKVKSIENKPFAFSRIDNNTLDIRLIIIANNEFEKIGACNILKNFNLKQFRLVSGQFPLDYAGSYTGSGYNYGNLTFANDYFPLIWSSRIIDVPLRGEYADIARSIAMCDLKIETIMTHS